MGVKRVEGKIAKVKLCSADGQHRVAGAGRRRVRVGRFFHRLHGFQRPADRQALGRRLRGLGRTGCAADRAWAVQTENTQAPPLLHARDRASPPAGNGAFRCSIASATASSTAAASVPTTRRAQLLLEEPDGSGHHRAAAAQIPHRAPAQGVASELSSRWVSPAASSSRSSRPAFT